MEFDFSACERFLALIQDMAHLPEHLPAMLAHPAYQMVREHTRRYGTELTEQHVIDALYGAPSPFFGVKGIWENQERIRALIGVLRDGATTWLTDAGREIHRLLPDEDLDCLVVYPILGYDMGIGLQESVCMNLNSSAYLDDPREFLYWLIHEVAHVLYERTHNIPRLAEVCSPAEWRSYFHLWTQNEGFATYAPLRLRQERGALHHPDYQVLMDPSQLADTFAAFQQVDRLLSQPLGHHPPDFSELVFGKPRLTYRAGCAVYRQVEQAHGLEDVRQAFYLNASAFSARFLSSF